MSVLAHRATRGAHRVTTALRSGDASRGGSDASARYKYLDFVSSCFTLYCIAVPKKHYATPAAVSAALRGVWALTTFSLNAQRRRTAGGVPRPLVSAKTRARNCSPNHCVQQIHFCTMTVLHRCQHFLHQRMSCNSAFSQRAIPEYFNDPPAFFPSPIALPMACFLLSTA